MRNEAGAAAELLDTQLSLEGVVDLDTALEPVPPQAYNSKFTTTSSSTVQLKAEAAQEQPSLPPKATSEQQWPDVPGSYGESESDNESGSVN